MKIFFSLRYLFVAALILFALPALLGAQQPQINSRYRVGQVWSYKTRANEKESAITVVKVESDAKLGNIIHISVNGLKLKNPDTNIPFTDIIAFMPFAEKAIDKSVIMLLRENAELPDFLEGYQEWRIAFEDRRATIYKIPVAEALKKAEENLNKNKRH
jgi:hypothetical protein